VGDQRPSDDGRTLQRRVRSSFSDGAPREDRHEETRGGLISRFRTHTEATEKDRSLARAHRFEDFFDPAFRQDLVGVEKQVKVFDRYLMDLFLILTKSSYYMKLDTLANVETTARNLADLVLMGSIHWAVLKFGLLGLDPSKVGDSEYYRGPRERYYTETK
jgi:hypothetical protein